MKVKVCVGSKIVTRKPRLTPFGNFVMASVRYNNEHYLLNGWDGDEYLRGADEEKIYTLGRKIEGSTKP